MAVAPLALSESTARLIFDAETSIVERGSILLWLALALGTPLLIRRPVSLVLAVVVVCIAAAAREADLLRSSAGSSILKFDYYLDPEEPSSSRIFAAALVASVMASAAVLAVAIIRRLRSNGGSRMSWGRIATATAILAIVSKMFDRAPAILGDAGLPIVGIGRRVMTSFEEHLELLLPVLAFLAMIALVRRSSGGTRNPEGPAGLQRACAAPPPK